MVFQQKEEGNSDNAETISTSSTYESFHLSQAYKGLPAHKIDEVIPALRAAQVHPDYIKHADEPFLVEVLSDETVSIIRPLAYAWVDNQSNLQRAANSVGRKVRNPKPLQYFSAFRFKAVSDRAETRRDHYLQIGLGIQTEKNETVVLVALEQWHRRNGFFANMDLGEDICLDKNAILPWPGTGGGLGIFISLDL